MLHLFPLYSHQSVAVDAARLGKNVILSTPSASGKTLSYNTSPDPIGRISSPRVNKSRQLKCLFPTYR
ncbi:hypothetical protein M1O16_03740 [Dehalococcoidia bacterium]|nr:hypothetical protein [Dehalococcoidia bacterium]